MSTQYALELPNDVRSIERAVGYLMQRCRDAGFEGERLRLNFRVGVTEALTNAMVYGNAGDPGKRVRVEVRATDRAVHVRITDEGHGFDPGRVPDPTLPSNRSRAGGRGIFLIRELMDRVEYNERGNSVTMVLEAEPEHAEREAARA
ncbi:MAG: ATP-binding protein [Gemmatimonadota bacterium]